VVVNLLGAFMLSALTVALKPLNINDLG